ncbi:MAG: ferredoxin [Lachnospiraceae bacterium]|uniref:Ferredoxin n=1 Tax=Porcincola intestinalis TaxID=2606632 RepID=A0A6L5WZE4_9FIRM|nr:ferredoxin [Porcincola intestinalis]MCI6766891.1 ferredoxin [Lachnospiraceae bacterium]MDY4205235.1 ferredoxin [Porcincola intestinalis]MSS13459.1 ferredoxin [Porcincola intestinalis]
MKYAVDENCIGCGLCNATCPEVFSMTDEGIVYDCLMP